jgi:hypothetical protein
VFGDHLRTHELLVQIRLPIKCISVEFGSFCKISNLLRHIRKFHNNATNVTAGPFNGSGSSTVPLQLPSIGHDFTLQLQSNVDVCDHKAVKTETTALVASLRAKSGATHSLTNEIMKSCQRVLNCQAA